MTDQEALKLAAEHFNRTLGRNPAYNSFTGERRVIDGAAAVAAYERETGSTLEPSQRERAERFYRVIFASALPPLDCGSHHVIIRVNKSTGETAEEIWD